MPLVTTFFIYSMKYIFARLINQYFWSNGDNHRVAKLAEDAATAAEAAATEPTFVATAANLRQNPNNWTLVQARKKKTSGVCQIM